MLFYDIGNVAWELMGIEIRLKQEELIAVVMFLIFHDKTLLLSQEVLLKLFTKITRNYDVLNTSANIHIIVQ